MRRKKKFVCLNKKKTKIGYKIKNFEKKMKEKKMRSRQRNNHREKNIGKNSNSKRMYSGLFIFHFLLLFLFYGDEGNAFSVYSHFFFHIIWFTPSIHVLYIFSVARVLSLAHFFPSRILILYRWISLNKE